MPESKAIDTVSWKRICDARAHWIACEMAERDAAEAHKKAKNDTAAAQEALAKEIDELNQPNIFRQEAE